MRSKTKVTKETENKPKTGKIKFDQHFMTDNALLEEIAGVIQPAQGDKILEIGAGHGELTRHLAQHLVNPNSTISANMTAVEIDPELAEELKKKLPKINVLNKNALKIPLKGYTKIIGNLPYNICEPLFNKLIRTRFSAGIFVLPDSFITKGLSALVIKDFFKIKIIKKIPKQAFKPKPDTSSILIKIAPKQCSLFGEIYLQQDKKLKNALLSAMTKEGMTKNQAREELAGLKKSGLKLLEKKGFELSAGEWQQVYQFIIH